MDVCDDLITMLDITTFCQGKVTNINSVSGIVPEEVRVRFNLATSHILEQRRVKELRRPDVLACKIRPGTLRDFEAIFTVLIEKICSTYGSITQHRGNALTQLHSALPVQDVLAIEAGQINIHPAHSTFEGIRLVDIGDASKTIFSITVEL